MKTVAFTESQQAAIDVSQRDRDTCIVAGPGSGKTTVLVEYFRRLVEEKVDPGRILAITFTVKAAGNMRAKLAKQFESAPEMRRKLERAWVSTVHGFCARLLRENAVLAGVDPQFTVADETESRRQQQTAIGAAVTGLFDEHPDAVRALIRGLSSTEFESAVLSAYDAMRGAGLSIEQVAAMPQPAGVAREEVVQAVDQLRNDPLAGWKPEQKYYCKTLLAQADEILAAAGPRDALLAIGGFNPKLPKCKQGTPASELIKDLRENLVKRFQFSLISELYQRERGTLFEIFRRFDRIYRERKRQAGVLDFSDLEEGAVRLLEESPQTRARVQAQFDYIVMDEFQDTNGQQARLLKSRREGCFYAVGDINQSIFGFRHAEPDVFRAYRDEVGRRVELGDNFRSRAEILSAVETITDGLPGIESRALVAKAEFAQAREVCVEVIGATAPQIDDALELESQWIARRILELTSPEGDGFTFGQIAVLVRNTEVFGPFTTAFEQAGIPYVVSRGKGFYEAREVIDLVHLLRVMANPRDELSLAAVLRAPLVRVSDEALLHLKTRDPNLGNALLRLVPEMAGDFDAADFEKLCRFRDRLHGWRLQREATSFDRLLLGALDDCGYPAEPGTRAWANIEKFLAQARRAAGRMSLDRFVDELAIIRDSDPREFDAPPDDSSNAVNVMTVHAAKGLEFPVVFVSALHKGVQTKPPVVAFSPRIGLGALWRHPGTGKETEDLFQAAIAEELEQREEQESSRLLYVAMTRAEEHLILSFSAAGKRRENWVKLITPKLGFDLPQAREETRTLIAPDEKEWRLKIRVADQPPGALPRPILDEAVSLVERIAAPVVHDQQDTNATVTAVAAFAKCPREYYLGHYLGYEGRARGLAESPELSAAEFGTQVHALLAGTPVVDADPEAVRLADVFRQSPLGHRAARAAKVEREFDFLMALDDLVLSGQVDLWFEEDGALTIVDYKTDSVTAQEAHQRASDYAVQLRIYAMAVERATGRTPKHAWLHFLRPNTAIEIDLNPPLWETPEEVVGKFQEAQSRLEFPLLEAAHCRRCPFFHGLCPSGYSV